MILLVPGNKEGSPGKGKDKLLGPAVHRSVSVFHLSQTKKKGGERDRRGKEKEEGKKEKKRATSPSDLVEKKV